MQNSYVIEENVAYDCLVNTIRRKINERASPKGELVPPMAKNTSELRCDTLKSELKKIVFRNS